MVKLRSRTVDRADAEVHVIFVHGLNGDDMGTWTLSTQPPVFWPDWLAEDLPHIAVWSLGYPAAASWWSRDAAMALPDRAGSLLPFLAHHPGLKQGQLVFVAHSLGGLVVTALLRRASDEAHSDPCYADFLARVSKVTFIASPHSGSILASIAMRLPLFRPQVTILDLMKNNPALRDLSRWFRNHVDGGNVQVLAMYENQPLRFLRFSFGLVVDAASADPGLPVRHKVIPIDADHRSIVQPLDRSAPVYVHLKRFIEESFQSAHPPLSLSRAIEALGARLDQPTLAENPLITRELEQQVFTVRKSRFISGYDTVAECNAIAAEIQSGLFVSASRQVKGVALAWLARILASKDPAHAQDLLRNAEEFGAGEEVKIAQAVIYEYRDGSTQQALHLLSALPSPTARSAAFLIKMKNSPSEALTWLQEAGLNSRNLDPDGRLAYIQALLDQERWDEAYSESRALDVAEFSMAPLLLHFSAVSCLVQCVALEFRKNFHLYLPLDPFDFPLRSDERGLEAQRQAASYFERAGAALAELGLLAFAHLQLDFALWLRLRDPQAVDAAKHDLTNSLADPQHRLRRLTLALDFGLVVDLAAAERETNERSALSGGASSDVAIARFALAQSKGSPQDIAKYLIRHRAELETYFAAEFLGSVEIEMLARGGLVAEAKIRLDGLRSVGVSEDAVTRLHQIIKIAEGSDSVALYEAEYARSGRLADLIVLFDAALSHRNWQIIRQYGGSLYVKTKESRHAEAYILALFNQGECAELLRFVEGEPCLRPLSINISHACAWSAYRSGLLEKARVWCAELLSCRSHDSDRVLQINLLVASGDWSALSPLVEQSWQDREQREPGELLRMGMLAQRLGLSSRSKDLVRDAARRGADDPSLLVAAYTAATSAGWEDSADIHKWLSDAFARSGPDGPIHSMSISDLIDQHPKWQEQVASVSRSSLTGEMPAFLAGRFLNRSLLDIHLVSALINQNHADARQRSLILAFSGARPVQQLEAKRAALDATAILTLAFCDLLQIAINFFEVVFIPHSFLGWLFDESQRLRFHQPSQVRRAEELRLLLGSNDVRRFEPARQLDTSLAALVGETFASCILAAKEDNDAGRGPAFAVHRYPVTRAGSLVDEVVDLTPHQPVLASCSDLVRAAAAQGHLLEGETQAALDYLRLRENDWPHNPVVSAGSRIYLDEVAVSHLQHLGLLVTIANAGFVVYVTTDQFERAEALVQHETSASSALAIVDTVREVLHTAIEAGKVQLGALLHAGEDDSDDLAELKYHPCLLIAEAARLAEIAVIDDRAFNMNPYLDVGDGKRPIYTTLDIVATLGKRGAIDLRTGRAIATKLRRGGFHFIPVEKNEASDLLAAADVSEEKLRETAELKALRQSIARLQMTDALQMPQEKQWLETVQAELLAALRKQWRSDVDDKLARARSHWAFEVLDMRRWIHRLSPTLDAETVQAMQFRRLLLLPNVSEDARQRYWKWLADEILAVTQSRRHPVVESLVTAVETIIHEQVDVLIQGEAAVDQ